MNRTLDCGCYLPEDGPRAWCPTCLDGGPKRPRETEGWVIALNDFAAAIHLGTEEQAQAKLEELSAEYEAQHPGTGPNRYWHLKKVEVFR